MDTFKERVWSRREHWMAQLILALVGLGLVFFDVIWKGLGFQPLTVPIIGILEGLGTALFVAGTVSFGIEELIRGRTLITFEAKLRELLAATGDKLTSQIIHFLESYVVVLGQRIEELGKEVYGSNIKMIYSSRAKGLEEMASAIKEADNFVYVMGISLREFFQLETPCSAAIAEVYHERKDVKFKVLIFNNRSAEALERSSREEGIAFSSIDDPEYKSKTLFGETRETITNIRKYCSEIALRVYDSQSLFLLITDKTAFMEPYHYGNRVVGEPVLSRAPFLRRVAELVPLIEFTKATERGPYEQFFGHFEYVFDKAKEPTEENVRV